VKDVDPLGYKMINQYRVIKEIGRGVHGKVKLAVDMDDPELKKWVYLHPLLTQPNSKNILLILMD
jgi:hypothetical protein